MNNAIEVKNLCKRFTGFTLQNVSFAVPEGTILGLVGENGAGKSTIVNLLMNAVPRDGGDVAVLGVDPTSPTFTETRQSIGVVLDEAYFPVHLNALDVEKMMRSIYRDWDGARFHDYLRRFDLPERKLFKDYSRGMRMKLAIAVALSHGAQLLILDEATGGLDPMARDELLQIISDFTRDERCTVLISSHIVSDLEKICDSIAFVHKGQLMFCEEKDRLLEDYALLRLTHSDAEAVPPEAIVGRRESPYDVEMLVRRALVNDALPSEHTLLEDVILFFAKGGAQPASETPHHSRTGATQPTKGVDHE